jgi:hypothetical protein
MQAGRCPSSVVPAKCSCLRGTFTRCMLCQQVRTTGSTLLAAPLSCMIVMVTSAVVRLRQSGCAYMFLGEPCTEALTVLYRSFRISAPQLRLCHADRQPACSRGTSRRGCNLCRRLSAFSQHRRCWQPAATRGDQSLGAARGGRHRRGGHSSGCSKQQAGCRSQKRRRGSDCTHTQPPGVWKISLVALPTLLDVMCSEMDYGHVV